MEYHPCSRWPVLHQPYEEFGINNAALPTMIALDAGLNKTQVNGLLELFLLVTKGMEQVTMKNDAELQKACDNAGAELTPFTKHIISAPYKGKEMEFEVHTRPVWDWALDLLADPQLAPHFVWDAERVYKHNGEEYERFYGEPWTCDHWWDIQSQLPADVENAIPFCFILYADKTRLSSHGTVKGYPVVVRCANLPVDIRNSESVGGGCVVGWLPIIPEDAAEEGKLGYTTLKCVVWHESAIKLFEAMVHFSATGFQHRCWDEIIWYLFPLFLILSADYEEQCMMSLIRGRNGKAPCPICLVPLELLHDISKTFALHNAGQGEEALRVYNDCKATGEAILKKLGLRPVPNVFWHIRYSDPHLALSFDRLHVLHLGLWGKHLFEDLKIILRYLGCDAEAMVERLTKEFPRWWKLFHFTAILKVTFNDGNKFADLSIQVFYPALSILTKAACPEGYLLLGLISSYLQLDSLIGLDIQTNRTLSAIETELLVFNERLQAYKECTMNSSIPGLKVDWDFPKVHLWKHMVCDIREKGAVRNYSTHPNEKMHGPLKEAYQDRSNGRDVAGQILRVDQHILACRLLRTHIDQYDKWHKARSGDDNDNSVLKLGFEGHCKLGSPCKPTTIQGIEAEHDREDKAYLRLQRKFTNYINKFLPSIGHELKKWVTIPADFNIYEYRYLKVNYKSCVDWKLATDHLRCNSQFFGTPRYDCAYVQLTSTQTAFVRLITFFMCQIHGYGELQLALIQPYTASVGQERELDQAMKLTRIKAVPRSDSTFIPLVSIIRGALLFPDPKKKDEFLVVDHVDGDMFLRMKTWKQGGSVCINIC
ncbi:hypothetical protein F5J12DRAFT_907015 [Pisolithus orientalis]|uniref:uncharacterized protein n=1 Tax=Pisolithus orientalis TaxID=936130 RepID=UPI002224B9A0|nr:uncharacterized protein F5J12DRAFT_907015 [Pisolithus orientalis]KAI5996912.1 hypothetical protein F5J12DRAFT_907015 [Pisolithus orientalis]